jgi:NAD(P)-dependent dehydrogenase (short-subunit alcohol dehydrogenase family)
LSLLLRGDLHYVISRDYETFTNHPFLYNCAISVIGALNANLDTRFRHLSESSQLSRAQQEGSDLKQRWASQNRAPKSFWLLAIQRIVQLEPSAAVRFEKIDLTSLDSVRYFSLRLLAQGRAIECLVNNAGILAPPQKAQSSLAGVR